MQYLNVEEVEPDEFDPMLLEEIQKDPECHEFVSQEDLMKELETKAGLPGQLHYHLYGESYRSEILTSRPWASCSIVSSRGLFRSLAISATVLFGTPVAIATWRMDRFFSDIIFFSNIFMGVVCADMPHDILENNRTILLIWEVNALSVLQKILGVLKPQSSPNIKVSLQDENVSESAAIASPAEPNPLYMNYAATLLLKAYGNVAPLPEHYPLYYAQECGLTNPKLLHQQLIDEEFLVPSSIPQILTTLKVSDLQQILRSYALKVSGKKEELINRILSNVAMEKLSPIFQNELPCYSLSDKGIDFLNKHKDYIRFHQYAKYGVSLDEYECAKETLCYSENCEQILIFLYNQKVDKDPYNRHYHLVLHELYEATGDSDNALREFLIVKYLDVNYVYFFQQLSFFLQYQSFSTAAKDMYESEKDHRVLTPSDASYVAEHQNIHLRNILNSIYSQYLLKDLIIPPNVFSTIVSEMVTESFFDVSKWNGYILSQLKHYLRLR